MTHGQCDGRPTVTFWAAEHHRPLAGTKLYCLVTEAHGCEQLARNCYPAMHRPGVKPATSRSQVQRPTTTLPSLPQRAGSLGLNGGGTATAVPPFRRLCIVCSCTSMSWWSCVCVDIPDRQRRVQVNTETHLLVETIGRRWRQETVDRASDAGSQLATYRPVYPRVITPRRSLRSTHDLGPRPVIQLTTTAVQTAPVVEQEAKLSLG